jgi:hypothetical protein
MLRRSSWTCTALLLGLAAPVKAMPARVVSIVGSDSSCPSPAAVGAALQAILPDVITAADPSGAALRVELSDAGPAFHVTAGSEARAFEDRSRRCGERANEAAVFIALVLEPPSVTEAPVRRRTVRRRPVVVLVAAPAIAVALAAHARQPVAAGGELQLFVGNRFVGGVVSAQGLSPVTLQVTAARAQLTRVPLSLAMRGQLRRRTLELAIDLGLVLSFQVTEGLDVTPSLRETRLELGLRAALQLVWWLRPRVGLVAGARFEWLPRPNDLTLAGAGIVGTTPSCWIGAMLGLAVQLQ